MEVNDRMADTPQGQELLKEWRRTDLPFSERDSILDQLIENNIFPGKEQDDYEVQGGVYPGLDDPQFLPKLIRKREFQESKQVSLKEQMASGVDKCRTTEDFEITPVQRFVSRLLSPRTPYHSALLYHGVGVGKTCAAVTVAESYLAEFPGKKIYVIAPPNIQEGFRRTIFDKEALNIGSKAGKEPNTHRGCTGNTYLDITGSQKEYTRATIETRVAKAVKSRYEFFGYTSFYNHIVNLTANIPKKGLTDAQIEDIKRKELRYEFSNRVIIIDEAHNLRDNPLETEDEVLDDATPGDSADAKAGKKLTPLLKEVLEVCEGTTLLLMTATPMYNNFTEIVFLLNLLLTNDKFARLRVEDIFDIRGQKFKDESGRRLLGKVASQYVSFMRGENPLTFPIRLEPISDLRVKSWPTNTPKGELIDAQERANCLRLPCISGKFSPETESIYKEQSIQIVKSSEGLGITNMDILIQAGNWIFPGDDADFLERIRQQGFERTFSKEKRGSLIYFKNTDEESGASWLLSENLPKASGKCAELLRRLNNCKGVAFVYSRFVASGALTIALALEANGYTCWNRDIGFLAEGNQLKEGRQCALCTQKERNHGTDHAFKPAKYILLTGSEEISPNNAKSIDAARSSANTNGEEVKVIIGSQIAGEGLDLRYIREVFVYDSWYHLNKLEQVVGRGIRNCSHSALPQEKRNCTITLLVNTFTGENIESIDMYSYRQALKKAIVVGNVTRLLKEYAIDCTLNREAILVKDLDPLPLIIDSQGEKRFNVLINDVPLTPMCDWLETCDYECKYGEGTMVTNIALEEQDGSTYDEYTARLQLNRLRLYLQDRIARGTPFVTFERIENDFSTIPRPLLASLLNEIVQHRDFTIVTDHGLGRIIYKNGFYIFQPEKIRDTTIPIAMRLMNIPIPRDRFVPKVEELVKRVEVEQSDTEDSEQLWDNVVEWSEEIRNGRGSEVPAEVLEEVGKLRETGGLMKAQKERLEMVSWIYNSVKEDPIVRGYIADILLEYMWDEYITTGTKRELLMNKWSDPLIRSVTPESFWEMDSNLYLRLVNSTTNKIEYICVDASGKSEACKKSVIEVLEREVQEDPLLKKPIDVRYTGFEYGFIIFNPKKKKFVFKKGVPPMPKGKITRGSECSINSGTTYELKLLDKFGERLRNSGKNDLGLNEVEMSKVDRRIQNSVRVCTVSDLVLRYMDKIHLEGKRWFYRPLEATLHGHPLR